VTEWPWCRNSAQPLRLAGQAFVALSLCALLASRGGSEEPSVADGEVAPEFTRVDDGRPIVPGYETLRVAGLVDPGSHGEILLGELNCLSCHVASEGSGIGDRITTKAAPDLSEIGQRATAGWLAAYLADPQAQKRGATMPNLFHDLSVAEREAAAEQLTHFLIGESGTLESPEHRPFRYRATIERGRALFHSVGCVACHAPEGGDTASSVPSVPLPDLAAKTSVAALTRFLLDPVAVRHGGRMPSLYLSEGEAADIAVYLLRDQEPEVVATVGGFEFEYFLDEMRDEDVDGFFDRPPPVYDKLTAAGTGRITALSLDLPIETSWGNHMFRYSGLMPVPTPGTYTFILASDRPSGSELLIDGEPVATKNRATGREITAEVELAAGDHAIAVTYYMRGDTEEPYLRVAVGGGAITTPIPLEGIVVLEDVRLTPTLPATLAVDAAAAERGRRLFAESGCASCHAMPGQTATHDPAVAELGALVPDATSEWHLAPGVPDYNLADHQRAAIAAALEDLDRLARRRSAEAEVTHTLATYNCYACHERTDAIGTVGGPDASRSSYFAVQPGLDLGNEGRLPPRLTGVGGKLKPLALESILSEDRLHARRHYMQTRMPRFGGEPIQRLTAALDATDSTRGDLDEPPFNEEAIEDGRFLVGDRGLRCMTCHDVGAYPAQGVSAINMARFYERVRPGWVTRWLSGPQEVSPGTRMPDFWVGGSVIHPDVADGTMAGQIDAIYAYISLAASMPAPEGMDIGSSLVLTPDDEPIIFRTFMTDVSPRAIVVGYPESVHLAFDANVMRLAKVWRGGFYDAQGTWSGRAGQFLNPYGDEAISMPPGPALAFLDSPDDPWPAVTMTDRNVGGRFLGYRLDDQRRPIFMYRLGGITIEERYIPVVRPGGASLTRSFSLEAGQVASGGLYLLLGEGDEIERNSDGSWTIDGRIRISLRSGTSTTPVMRSSQGVQQLLLPIGITSSQSVAIDVEISW
jgi:mono/diheme cytochrome c family protein